MGSLATGVVHLPRDAPLDEIIRILHRDGGVIIDALESPELMEQIKTELHDGFKRAVVAKSAGGEAGAFKLTFPAESQRINIVGNSTSSDKLLMNTTVQAVIHSVLSEEFPFYFGEPLYHAVSKPQLAAALAIKCLPGNAAQGLHRDDSFNHTVHPGPESQVTAIWAATDATKENGATEVLPRSHFWNLTKNPNEHRDEIVYAEMKAGSCLLILGGLYHAGGRNNTLDQTRVLFTFFYNKGYLRQEENMYLSIPRDVIKSKSKQIQDILGYSVSKPGAGYFNGGDPKAWLKDEGEDLSDLGTQFLY